MMGALVLTAAMAATVPVQTSTGTESTTGLSPVRWVYDMLDPEQCCHLD